MTMMEWMCWQGEAKQAKKETFVLPLSLYRPPGEGMAQAKGVSSHLKIWIKG